MFNKACKYAIRAALYLSIHSDSSEKIGVQALADELEVPQAYLAQILRQLTTEGIVSSAKGPGGGFYLSAENRRRSLWDVIRCIDKDYPEDECMLGLARCNNRNPCPIHHIAEPFRRQLLSDFRTKSLDRLSTEIIKHGTVVSLRGIELKS